MYVYYLYENSQSIECYILRSFVFNDLTSEKIKKIKALSFTNHDKRVCSGRQLIVCIACCSIVVVTALLSVFVENRQKYENLKLFILLFHNFNIPTVIS